MDKNYQEIIDELFGSYYKHRTLRTVFDPYSSEWNDTTIDEKIKILKTIIDSNKISLSELINSYKWFYTESLSNKSHVIDALEDSLIIILQKVL